MQCLAIICLHGQLVELVLKILDGQSSPVLNPFWEPLIVIRYSNARQCTIRNAAPSRWHARRWVKKAKNIHNSLKRNIKHPYYAIWNRMSFVLSLCQLAIAFKGYDHLSRGINSWWNENVFTNIPTIIFVFFDMKLRLTGKDLL